jgi:hypothetical protein
MKYKFTSLSLLCLFLAMGCSREVTLPGSSGTTNDTTLSVPSSLPALTLVLRANNSTSQTLTVDAGTAVNLTWVSNADSCALLGVTSAFAGTDQYSLGAVSTTIIKTLTCLRALDNKTTTAMLVINVIPQAVLPAITANFVNVSGQTITALTVAYNTPMTLRWVTNGNSCTLNGVTDSDGQHSLGQVTANSTHTLICTRTADGASKTATLAITVTQLPAMTANFVNASGQAITTLTVDHNTSVTLRWVTNGNTCTLNGVADSDLQHSLGQVTANSTHTLSCTRTADGANKTATLNITVNPPVVLPAITANFVNANGQAITTLTVDHNTSVTLRWVTNGNTCTLNGVNDTDGEHSLGPVTANSTHTLICTRTVDGASRTATLNITVTPLTALTADFVNGSYQPITSLTVDYGNPVTLRWATNGDSCTLNGQPDLDNQHDLGFVTENSTNTLNCRRNLDGATKSATITVSVNPRPLPNVMLRINGENALVSVVSGSSVTLAWTSSDANTCELNKRVNGVLGTPSPVSLSGTQQTTPLTVTTEFVVTCKNSTGERSATATANVTAPRRIPKILHFTANGSNPGRVLKGELFPISWATENTKECLGPSGISATNLSPHNFAGITQSVTYTLKCQGIDDPGPLDPNNPSITATLVVNLMLEPYIYISIGYPQVSGVQTGLGCAIVDSWSMKYRFWGTPDVPGTANVPVKAYLVIPNGTTYTPPAGTAYSWTSTRSTLPLWPSGDGSQGIVAVTRNHSGQDTTFTVTYGRYTASAKFIVGSIYEFGRPIYAPGYELYGGDANNVLQIPWDDTGKAPIAPLRHAFDASSAGYVGQQHVFDLKIAPVYSNLPEAVPTLSSTNGLTPYFINYTGGCIASTPKQFQVQAVAEGYASPPLTVRLMPNPFMLEKVGYYVNGVTTGYQGHFNRGPSYMGYLNPVFPSEVNRNEVYEMYAIGDGANHPIKRGPRGTWELIRVSDGNITSLAAGVSFITFNTGSLASGNYKIRFKTSDCMLNSVVVEKEFPFLVR